MATTESIRFRKATEDNTIQVQKLVEAAFQADDSRPNWTAGPELNSTYSLPETVVRSVINNPESAFLMAYHKDDALIGAVAVSKRAPDVGRVSHLAIDREHQRAGLGRYILTYAEQYCHDTWGVKRVGLNALSSRESLISWYERRGYRKTGEQTTIPIDRAPELNLPKVLICVEMEKAL